MKIQVKQIHVLEKVIAENNTYTYLKTIIPINRVMSLAELKTLQKQTAINYSVPQNMIGGVYEVLRPKKRSY